MPAQILKLFRRLQEEDGLSHLFITNDPAVVVRSSTGSTLSYLGEVVESGPTEIVMSLPPAG